MNKKGMSNKTLLIILGIAVVLTLVLFIVLKVGNKDKENKILECSYSSVKNNLNYENKIYVTTKGDSVIFHGQSKLIKLADSEKLNYATNLAIQYIFKNLISSGLANVESKDNIVEVNYELDLTKYTPEEIKGFIGVEYSTIDQLKIDLEAGGLQCEQY